jgi:hypothetical protein
LSGARYVSPLRAIRELSRSYRSVQCFLQQKNGVFLNTPLLYIAIAVSGDIA